MEIKSVNDKSSGKNVKTGSHTHVELHMPRIKRISIQLRSNPSRTFWFYNYCNIFEIQYVVSIYCMINEILTQIALLEATSILIIGIKSANVF